MNAANMQEAGCTDYASVVLQRALTFVYFFLNICQFWMNFHLILAKTDSDS